MRAGHRRGICGIVGVLVAGILAATAPAQQHHHHGGGERDHPSYGPPIGSYPALAQARPRARSQARRLWKRTLRAAAERFPTYRAARRRGFVRYEGKLERPVVFHVRSRRYSQDRRELDPRRPESLVYWWPARGAPVLIGFMYRMPPNKWPRYAKPLLAWHAHKRGVSVMTHVWLTRSLRTAIANCMPVSALEAANPAYRFSPPSQGYSIESHPCREFQPTATAAGAR